MQMLREHYVNFECSLNIQKQVTPKKMLHEFPTKKKKMFSEGCKNSFEWRLL